MTCTKRSFDSVAAARRAHGKAGFRVRVYRCPNCPHYHVTNHEKGDSWPPHVPGGEQDKRLAPAMTFEELQAEAARRRSGGGDAA